MAVVSNKDKQSIAVPRLFSSHFDVFAQCIIGVPSTVDKIYFRNIYDHTIQIIETLESLRDLTSGMMDLYLSSVSNKMNEIMKVLTIFSTIFIPLTFFAGVYGMNFKFLPELEWKYGYFAFWGVMIIITLCMLAFFRRKKWL